MIGLLVGFVLGVISSMMGYGITTWQFWFITLPLALLISFVLRR